MPETRSRSLTIGGQAFRLSRSDVERAMRGVLPEPIREHYVVVGSRRYPPKQVIGEVTELERAFFTSHHALRVLRNLGFAVGRQHERRARPGEEPMSLVEDQLARRLLDLRGQWVATKGEEVLIAAPAPQEVVSWLARHHREADSMFRVPEDELAATGLAPL